MIRITTNNIEPAASKICNNCRVLKDLKEFNKDKYGKFGRQSQCKKCLSIKNKEYYLRTADSQRAKSRDWHSANPERARERQLLRKFGLTIALYDELLLSQGGVCAICSGIDSGGKFMPVDHDRSCCAGDISCGKCVRGILCTNCNRGLGCVRDNIDTIRGMEAYLVKFQERSDVSE